MWTTPDAWPTVMTAQPTGNCTVSRVWELDDSQVEALASVTIDCVEGGASIGFMNPLTRDRALSFWRWTSHRVSSGERALLIAEDKDGICGTVQLIMALPENQPHRAEITKMLVHGRARRQGVGAALMRAAEGVARENSKTLLVLDAVTGGDAARLYEKLGWVRVGDVPNFALMPDGAGCSTTFYYKRV